MNWKQILQQLPADACFVQHQPFTPRYRRAANKIEYLLENAVFLGVRDSEGRHSGCLEIATWAPEPARRRDGYFACFRVHLQDDAPTLAVLYCFYDGTDQSLGFRSLEAAAAYAYTQGFRDEVSDDHRA